MTLRHSKPTSKLRRVWHRFRFKDFVVKVLVLGSAVIVIILIGGYAGEMYSLGRVTEMVLTSIAEAVADVVGEEG